ncbi:DNA-primase RepB domain-containing protein [Agrobacterium rosae]|uniref:DNA-primase RepB domain-containing protein n=1 Tax=Agrobacterium rosae TaxID=1972867 RepID=UPI002A139CA0|nr:DNA-primase RepB domain-containing protein [Agrobacterium rosae]MDX8314425.1 DNA-primase RepB domain-containing protein [Agrobacterium rosae]
MKNYKARKPAQNTIQLFRNLDHDEHVIHSQLQFLRTVWSHIADGSYMFLSFKNVATGKWQDHAIQHGGSLSHIATLLHQHSRWDNDQYFCLNPFSEPRRRQQYALPTPFSWCDMDESDPNAYDPRPSVVWQTSPLRYQAFWLLNKTHRATDAELFSKSLAYRHGGDRNGWSATKMLRIPGSVNHKPQYDEPFVKIIRCDWSAIASRPVPLEDARHSVVTLLPTMDIDPTKHDRDAVLKRYFKSLHPKVRTLIRSKKAYEPDRSAQVYHMIVGLHEAGATSDEIGSVLWQSPYFLEKYGRDANKLNDEISRVIGKLEGGK